MKSYSQTWEDLLVANFFGHYIGVLLSIGENDGKQYSNALALLERGWGGCLIEPSPQVFPELWNLHKENPSVYCYNLAIGDKDGEVTLYDSGELVGQGDLALVSSIKKEETMRWDSLNIPFNEVKVNMLTFDSFMGKSPFKRFDFISVDAEGYDLIILRQMDLDKLGCRCLCIEHNSIPANVAIIREQTEPLGFRQIGYTAENIILAR